MILNSIHTQNIKKLTTCISGRYGNKCVRNSAWIVRKNNQKALPRVGLVCRNSFDFQDHYRLNESYDVETRNFSYVKETYIDLVNKMLQQCDLSKSEDRQLLAMFISSYFLKVLAFRKDMNEDKILYHKAIGMHFIIETGECDTVDEFYLLMDDFIDMVERTKYTD